jgi:hypothetical protein
VRERVMNVEAAERDADRALASAREAVRDTREHIKRWRGRLLRSEFPSYVNYGCEILY